MPDFRSDKDRNLRVTERTPGFRSLGSYACGVSTGAITATLSANSNLFYVRWTDSTRYALIQKIWVNAYVTGTITAAVNFRLGAFFGTGFSVAPSANQTAATLTSRNCKLRTSMGTTLMTAIYSCTTAGMTGATITLDTQPFAEIGGNTGTAVGTQFFGNAPAPIFQCWYGGIHPVVLAANEGICVQNLVAGPATGTFTCAFSVQWVEVDEY